MVGAELERRFKRLNVWMPLRDTGIGLLVSDRRNRRTVSSQMKFGKDFLVTHMPSSFQKELCACGWWTSNRGKLRTSPADYWIFVVQGFATRTANVVVILLRELRRRLTSIHRRQRVIHTCLWVTENEQCFETRGLNRAELFRVAQSEFRHKNHDLIQWLNNRLPVARLNCRPL